jgi:signal transduction histidine kinase
VEQLRQGGYDPTVTRIETADRLHEALREKWDVVFAEYLLPRFGALEALRVLNERGSDVPVIVVSSAVSDRQMHEALAAGAGDYVARSDAIRLKAAISREMRAAAARRERRHLEEQFRHSQRMEAVGRLAGGVAHDFNNLLTIISGWAELLLAGDGLETTQRAAVEEIRRASQRGGALAHRLLAFSRRQPMAPRIVNINEVLVGLEKMLRPMIGEHIELITLAGARHDTVRIDPGQLEQVLLNLVVNARDAMPHGGKLVLEAAEAHFDASSPPPAVELSPGHYVALSIGDSGIGMDEQTLAHIFEPFFTTKPTGQGTGLGLATAYGIVRQSGGAITVDSKPGRGTTMKIYLPRVEAPQRKEAAKEAAAPAPRGWETVLVVEDEPRVRKLMCDVLARTGYRVIEASRGKEALDWLSAHQDDVHLAVLDVIMPEMNGPEAGMEVARLRPGVKRLFISGYADEAILHHGVLASGAEFLQKPFPPHVLVAKVREVLDAGRAAAASPDRDAQPPEAPPLRMQAGS